MSTEEPRKEIGFLNTSFDEPSINPEILPAVISLRNAGVETIASNSGIGEIGLEGGWGSYIQIILPSAEYDLKIVHKVDGFAKQLTSELRQELNNPAIALQLVSAEKWFDDIHTTSIEISKVPIYRLQLTGCTNDQEISHVWKTVAEKFNRSVIE
jgi:hypothetical protein